MLILEIDKNNFDKILRSKGMSANQLTQTLKIRKHPTSRLLTTWVGGGVVAPRWRHSIATAFKINEAELFDAAGRMNKHIMRARGMSRKTLSSVSIEETVTRAAVTNWRRGGGIEPDKLIALAVYLGVLPIYLLSARTQELLTMLMGNPVI